MQGYIIKVTKSKNEDLIVNIITQNSLETLYRFYGARHGTINLGFKIDFEIERTHKSTMGRLYDVIHLGYPWLQERNRLLLWHQFISLFYPHLKDSEEIGTFYFDLLDATSLNWDKQNPKRVAIESYIKLLEHEGRLYSDLECFFCSVDIEDDEISIIRSFLPTHKRCSHTLGINKKGLMELYENHSTLFLDDVEVDRLWLVLLEGV